MVRDGGKDGAEGGKRIEEAIERIMNAKRKVTQVVELIAGVE